MSSKNKTKSQGAHAALVSPQDALITSLTKEIVNRTAHRKRDQCREGVLHTVLMLVKHKAHFMPLLVAAGKASDSKPVATPAKKPAAPPAKKAGAAPAKKAAVAAKKPAAAPTPKPAPAKKAAPAKAPPAHAKGAHAQVAKKITAPVNPAPPELNLEDIPPPPPAP